jgi:hypothetical protein
VLQLAITAAAALLVCASAKAAQELSAAADSRDIRTGHEIPSQGYADQPYVVVLPDGAWLAVLTTGPGHEGQGGQHVVSTRSADRGRTWSPLVDIEPADGPEASWAVPLVTPSGRVYVFYDYNGDRVDTLAGKRVRADMLGWYCCRWTDDGGRTWSAERLRLPMRVTACDRANDWGGRVQIFWGVSKPVVAGGAVLFGFTKLGRYMLDDGEGWVWRSENVLTEADPHRVRWDLLPDGDHGIRAPQFGSVQEEHIIAPMSGGRLLCVYRTTAGVACQSFSDDGGRTWTAPEPMAYAPGGPPVKNPRANVKVWRTAAGRFLLWFHNHGGRDFKDRNPAWLAAGEERGGGIHWSQPEVLLYHPDPQVRMSYPDLIEQDGRFWVTETEKVTARVHAIDPALVAGLWGQLAGDAAVPADGLRLDLAGGACAPGAEAALGALGSLAAGGGFSVEMHVRLSDAAPGETLLDARDGAGRGFALATADGATVRLTISDGTTSATWDADAGALAAGAWRHIVAVVDGGPKLITFIVDGRLCDGGDTRLCGWGRFPAALGDASGGGKVVIGPSLRGDVRRVRIYGRALRTSEAVALFRAAGKE